MESLTSPGQDLYEALCGELQDAPRTGADVACLSLVRAQTGQGRTWGELPMHARAIFSAAAARFLSE